MYANISICRDSNDRIRLKIQDASSLMRLYEGSLTLEQFSRAITGEAPIQAETEYVCSPNEAGKVGLHRIVRNRKCEKVDILDRRDQENLVIEDFKAKWQSEGWALLDDGTRSQQQGAQHNYLICKWMTDAEIEDHGLQNEVQF